MLQKRQEHNQIVIKNGVILYQNISKSHQLVSLKGALCFTIKLIARDNGMPCEDEPLLADTCM
jgi:hypothetical protein